MSSVTTNFGLIKPSVNSPVDQDQWGTELNANMDAISLLVAPLDAPVFTPTVVNTSGIKSTGTSLTGVGTAPVLDLAGTWNTTGVPSGIKLNVTDTASDSASLLLDLQVGGVSKFSIPKTGSLVPSQTAGIVGTTTNNNVNAGSVGELIESEVMVGSAVSLTNGTSKTITSISLTAGDWDVWASVVSSPNGATVQTLLRGAIGTVNNAFPVSDTNGGGTGYWGGSQTGKQLGVFMQKRISLSSTTTIYLLAYAEFTTSTQNGAGYIGARRRR